MPKTAPSAPVINHLRPLISQSRRRAGAPWSAASRGRSRHPRQARSCRTSSAPGPRRAAAGSAPSAPSVALASNRWLLPSSGAAMASAMGPSVSSRPPRTRPPCPHGRGPCRPTPCRGGGTAAPPWRPGPPAPGAALREGPWCPWRGSASMGMTTSRMKAAVRSRSSARSGGSEKSIMRPSAFHRPIGTSPVGLVATEAAHAERGVVPTPQGDGFPTRPTPGRPPGTRQGAGWSPSAHLRMLETMFARLAQWFVAHRKRVLIGWLLAAVALTVAGTTLAHDYADGGRLKGTDSDAVYQILAKELPTPAVIPPRSCSRPLPAPIQPASSSPRCGRPSTATCTTPADSSTSRRCARPTTSRPTSPPTARSPMPR